jgi:ABC-type enterochelin transport system permease subunit
MNLVNIMISIFKGIGLLIIIGLVNIQLFWSMSGFIQKLLDLLGL